MIKITLIILTIVAFTLGSYAQEKRDTIRPANKVTPNQRQMMRDELGLSKEQAKKLKTINQDFRSKMQSVKGDSTLTRGQRKEKSRELLKSRSEEVDKILTPDQQKKFHELERQQMAKRKNKEAIDD
jgi:Spy/CpxP family protein refolding chaperone